MVSKIEISDTLKFLFYKHQKSKMAVVHGGSGQANFCNNSPRIKMLVPSNMFSGTGRWLKGFSTSCGH